MTKKCKKCGLRKPLSSFPIRKAMRDGHRSECSNCRLTYQQYWIARKRKDPLFVARNRAMHREKTALYRSNGKVWPCKYSTAKRWFERNRLAQRAQVKANRAQRRGILVKPKQCSNCGCTRRRLEKHHADYSKPLEVRWLCSKCHGLTRRKPIPQAA